MHTVSISAPPLTLVPLSGPPIERLIIDPARPVVLGRSSRCDVPLAHPQVSRQHASISFSKQNWLVRDLSSRHGAWLNGGRLTPEQPTPLRRGDVLQLGPWAFRVDADTPGDDAPRPLDEFQATLALRDDEDESTGVTQALALGRELARQHLDILLDAIEFAASAADSRAVAEHLARAARRGGGFRRAVVLRQSTSERADILAADGHGLDEPVSRTLLAAAAEGQPVELRDFVSLGQAQSIVDRGVRHGMCLPFRCGGEQLFLYVDSTRDAAPADAGPLLLDALARTAGLAMERLAREHLHARQQQIEDELRAARRVQQLITPPPSGETCAFRYALRSDPGRFVAGDLVGVVPLGPRRAAAFLGDVSGKGMAASILMAATQSALQTSLQAGADVAAAVHSLNRHIARISAQSDFVTLVLLVADLDANAVTILDAGHGYIAAFDARGNARLLPCDGGIPVGIDDDCRYTTSTFPLDGLERIVLFSDGVAERRSADAEQFGVPRALDSLLRAPALGDDLAALFADVDAFAADSHFERDDTTAISLAFTR